MTTSRERLTGPRGHHSRVRRPPGPSGWSLLRAFTSKDPSHPVRWFERTARAYPGVCHVAGPGRHTYVVSDAALVHELLHRHGRFLRKGAIFDVMKALFGEGLLTLLYQEEGAWQERLYSTRSACPVCGESLPDLSPRTGGSS